MASKIQSHNFYVAITPYKVEDSSADEFNLLNVMTAFDDRRKYFYVDLHAGWSTGWGGFGCILMGDDNPLTGPKYVKVKDAPRNSQKTINEIGANLEQAKDAIAWLFDHREWAKLYSAVRNIALYGYTEGYRKQMEGLMNANDNDNGNNSNNIQNSEDKTMKLNLSKNNESANVQDNAQVNNEVESVNVGEVTLATIMPKMTAIANDNANANDNKPVAPTKQEVKTGRTKIVVAGVPKSSLPRVTLVTYVTKRGETAPRIIGFSGEDDPRWKPIHDEKQTMIAAYNKAKKKDPKAKMTSSPFGPAWLSDREGNGEKTYCMTLGVKYMDVARQLCEAYNTPDRNQWVKAEQAVRDLKAGIAAGYQAEREAKRAAREAQKSERGKVKREKSAAAQPMSDEEQAMFDLFKKFMAGDKDAMDKVDAVLNKAA